MLGARSPEPTTEMDSDGDGDDDKLGDAKKLATTYPELQPFFDRFPVELANVMKAYQTVDYKDDKDPWGATAKMLRAMARWREEWSIDKICDSDLPRSDEFYRLFPMGVSGYDKKGFPIMWVCCPSKKISEEFTEQQCGRFLAQITERIFAMASKQAKLRSNDKTGSSYEQIGFRIVVDAGYTSLLGLGTASFLQKAMTWSSKSTVDYPAEAYGFMSYFYSGLEKQYIINAPFAVRFLTAFGKKFMAASTAAKVCTACRHVCVNVCKRCATTV